MKSIAIVAFAATLACSPLLPIQQHAIAAPFMQTERPVEELRTYVRSEIFPTLQQWKSDVDKIFTAEELQQLNILREKASTLRKEMREQHKALRPPTPPEFSSRQERMEHRKEMREEMREKMQPMKEEMRSIMEDLRPLAENHKDELKSFFTDKKPIAEQWRKEMGEKIRSMVMERLEEHPQAKHKAEKFMHKMEHRFRPDGLPPFLAERHGKKAVAMFLLWDGTLPELEQLDMPEPRNKKMISPLQTSLFPNPAKEQATLEFTLNEGGKVEIMLFDQKGYTVKSMFSGTLGTGKQSVPLNLSGIANGSYTYRLTTPQGTITGKLSVVR